MIVRGILAGAVALVVFLAGKQICAGLTADQVVTLIGTFTGALFAFLFVLGQDRTRRIREEKDAHMNSLIELERFIGIQVNHAENNVEALNQFLGILSQNKITIPIYTPFDFNPELVSKTRSLRIVNDFFNLIGASRHYNTLANNLIAIYMELKDSLFTEMPQDETQSQIFAQKVASISSHLAPSVEGLIEQMNKHKEDCLDLLALTRVAINEIRPRWRVIKFFSRYALREYQLPDDLERRVAEERALIRRS